IGPFASGTFAVFPIVMGSFAVIMHPRAGGKAAAAVFAHAQPALAGLCLGFLGVHYLVEPIGVWWSLAAGLAITMTWSAVLWLVRRARLRIAWLGRGSCGVEACCRGSRGASCWSAAGC